jgi:hypothetical protein
MQIELRIGENEFVMLSPYRIDSPNNHNLFELMDSNAETWMELELIDNAFLIKSQDEKIIDTDDDLRTKLNQLVLAVIEAEQSGTDLSATDQGIEEQPFDPEDIKVHAKPFSLRLITDMIDSEDIDLAPDFQRNLVWNNFQKSRLIESILLRIPLPMFYFSEDGEGKITIVDGLQRISTIKEFMDNGFALKKLEYLGETCNDRYFKTDGNKKGLDAKYVRWFNQTQFSVNVIDPSSPSKVKYDIFRRINTGGKPLNNQEIRNCLSGSSLRDTLKKMTNLKAFKSATDWSIRSTRMEDHEVALRFILFHKLKTENRLEDYNGAMDWYLDDLTEKLYKATSSELDQYVQLFKNAMLNAEFLFGSRYAFRKIKVDDTKPGSYKQLINKALFVSVSVMLSTFDPEMIKTKNSRQTLLLPLAEKIEKDRAFLNFLSYGTNGKSNVLYAFQKISELIDQNLTT